MNMYASGEYKNNNPTWHDEDAPWKADEIIKILAKNNLHPKSVVDIGCGTGSILKIIKKRLKLAQALGYEPFGEVLKMAKIKNPSLAFTSKLPDKKFDLALLIDVIEHVKDMETLLDESKNAATHKIFHIPLALSLQARLRKKQTIQMSRIKSGHLHEFNKKTALSLLELNGFEIIDATLVAGAILSPKKSNKQRFLNIFRKILFPLFPSLTSSIFGGYSLMVLAK